MSEVSLQDGKLTSDHSYASQSMTTADFTFLLHIHSDVQAEMLIKGNLILFLTQMAIAIIGPRMILRKYAISFRNMPLQKLN